MSKAAALSKVNAFKSARGPSKWTHLVRTKVADGLIARINNPNLVAQRQTPNCGPATITRALAKDKPLAYAEVAISLFTTGKATIGKMKIAPGSELLRDKPEGNTDQADWIMLASIRDSDNWFLSTSGWFSSSLAGITLPSTIEKWFKQAGYTKIVHKTHVALKPIPTVLAVELNEADGLRKKGYWVLFLVDSDVLSTDTQDDIISMHPDHWIALAGPITDKGITAKDDPISFKAWSWGRTISVPENAAKKPLKKKEFLHKYYGFIAARM